VQLSHLWKSVTIGLSIAAVTSSFVLTTFLYIGSDSLKMIVMIYLYYIVGALTGYLVYKYMIKNPSKIKPILNQKVKKQTPEKKVDDPKEELVNVIEYKQFLDKINNLKTTSLIVKGLIKTRKQIEELKKETNFILEDTVEKMDSKSLELTKNYLQTS